MDERERREGEQLAPALFPASAVTQHTDGYEVEGPALRGRVHLMSCYTPAWWYACCESCPGMGRGGQSPDDPSLRVWARLHRCGTDPVEEAMTVFDAMHTATP